MIVRWNWGGQQPRSWLIWYPVHHDLLMIGFLLGALLTFHRWLLSGKRSHLVATWCLFLLGALSKELVYVFPTMAMMVACMEGRFRPALRQIGIMLGVVGGLYLYRSMVLPHPRNLPGVAGIHIFWNATYFLIPVVYRNLAVPEYLGLAALIFALGASVLWLHRSRYRGLIERRFGWTLPTISILAIVWIYLAIVFPSAADGLFTLSRPARYTDLAEMLFAMYVLSLLWKNRKTHPTLAVCAIVVLSYLPVLTYLGWHYLLTAWFIRCAFLWPLVAELIWQDVSKVRKSWAKA
jgi:hypothetical protein